MSSNESDRHQRWVDELSESELREMIEKVKCLREDHDSLMADTDQAFFSYLRSLAGDQVADLINDKNATLSNLNSDDPALREVALRLAHSHWHMEDEVADKCEVLVQTDPSEAVRDVALIILGTSYRDTKDVR